MGYIYKVTNKVNGKVYIGKTENSIRVRWNGHVSNSLRENSKEKNFKFHNAIRKYGKDAFTIEVIDEVEQSETMEREKYWIEFYDSVKNGYNTTIGGEGSSPYSEEFMLECWKSGLTYHELREKYGMSTTTLRTRFSGLFSEEEIKQRKVTHMIAVNGTTVYQYDRQGNYVGSYPSVNEATRKTGIHHIDQVARGERNHAGGFIWSYVKLEEGDSKRVISKSSITNSESAA